MNLWLPVASSLPFMRGDDAVAGQGLEGADLGRLHAALLAALHNGAGQRVLALLLQREGEVHELAPR